MGRNSNSPPVPRQFLPLDPEHTLVIALHENACMEEYYHHVLHSKMGLPCVKCVGNVEALKALLADNPRSVVIYNPFSGHFAGIYLAMYIQQAYPYSAMISHSDYRLWNFTLKAERFGFKGYVPYNLKSEGLREVVQKVMAGEARVSLGITPCETVKRYKEVENFLSLDNPLFQSLLLWPEAKSLKDTGTAMNIDSKRVSDYHKAIMEHTGLDCIAKIIRFIDSLKDL